MVDDDVLTGDRVQLRRPALHDAEALFDNVTSEPQVTRYLSWRPHTDVQETREVVTGLFNVGEDRTWLIALRADGQVIGQIGCRRTGPHAVDVGYCLGRPWWGRGLMSEALNLLVDRLTDDDQIYRVAAFCHVDNVRSAALLQRCGLVLEGRLRRHTVFPNLSAEPQDTLLYALAVR